MKCILTLGVAVATALALVSSLAPITADGESFSYYRNGLMITESAAALRQQEEWSVSGGHQPWRKNPAMVAAVMTAILLPDLQPGQNTSWETEAVKGRSALVVTASSWQVVYTLVEEHEVSAVVALEVVDNPSYRIELKRSFGYGWFVTAVTTAKPGDEENGIYHKSDEMVAMRPLLESRGFKVSWSKSSNSATAELGNVKLVAKPGCKTAELRLSNLHLITTSAVVGGRTTVPYRMISIAITEDAVRNIARVDM